MPPSPVILAAANVGVDPLLMLVDGWPNITPKLETRIGREPIDTGASVTDHAVADPPVVNMVGIVSDLEGTDRVAEAWQTVYQLHQEVTVVRVVTEWGIYEEMLIERAEGRQVGRGLELELVLRQVLRVEAARVLQPVPAAPGGAGGNVPLPQPFGSADFARSLAADRETSRGLVGLVTDAVIQSEHPSIADLPAVVVTDAAVAAERARASLQVASGFRNAQLFFADNPEPEPFTNPRQTIPPATTHPRFR